MPREIDITISSASAPPPPPPPPPSGSALVASAAAYTGQSSQQSTTTLENGIRSALGTTGNMLAGFHGYSGSSFPKTFQASSVYWSYLAGYTHSWLNVKLNSSYNLWHGAGANTSTTLPDGSTGTWQQWAVNFANSVPLDHTCYLALHHEPENDGVQPNSDGGTWENQYGPDWCAMQGTVMGAVADLNLTSCVASVIHMGVTFPTGSNTLGINNRNPANWNCWQYFSANAKQKVILAPDDYTKVTQISPLQYSSMASHFDHIWTYVNNHNWGQQYIGMSEHNINNEIGASGTAVGTIWAGDVKPYLQSLGNQLAFYVNYDGPGTASGTTNPWIDTVPEYTEFGKMAAYFNRGLVL